MSSAEFFFGITFIKNAHIKIWINIWIEKKREYDTVLTQRWYLYEHLHTG